MKIDISIGELVDKVTILAIKLEKFKDETKKANVRKEYDILTVPMNTVGITADSKEFKDLKDVNLKLWHIEDDIRIKEQRKEFDKDFIELARSVYFTNDVRADIKKEINLKYNSELVEEKEYVDYKNK
ncbi:MAG TPA: DUF6165 family protein [Clostridiales bacterium]|nr:DUF6165 family protein [Clostridiales bacterium]